MSYNDVFADVVNVLMFDGERVIQPDDLRDQTRRSAYKADGKLREIERDVAKHWDKNNIRIACLGVENQSAPDRDIVLRVYGYDGAEYRWQLTKANEGKNRYPVITLVLYFGEKRWNGPLTLYDRLDIPDKLKPFISDVRVNLIEVAYLDPETVSKFQSDFRIVADYFVQKRLNGVYEPTTYRIEHVQETLQLLSVMTQDHRFEDILDNSSELKEGVNMCEVLDLFEQRGIEKGESKVVTLLNRLRALGRIDDVFKALQDPDYRSKLYKEFNIV